MQTIKSMRDVLPPPDSMLPWLVILTMGWLCVYGVFAFGFDRQLRRLVGLNPLVYPESLVTKSSILANYFTSTMNCVVAILAVVTVVRGFRKETAHHASVDKELVQGSIVAKTDFYYFCFMAYVVYDSIYESLLSETAKFDFVMLTHHVLYFLCTLLIYLSDSLVLLTTVLMAQEFSTPFVSAMHVMKIFHLENTAIFTINVAVMTLSFFAFRVILPILALVHVFMHCQPDAAAAQAFFGFATDEATARTIAIVLVLGGQVMQLYWFTRIVRGLLRHVSGEKIKIPESANDLDDDHESPVVSSSRGRKTASDTDDQTRIPLINPDEAAGVF